MSDNQSSEEPKKPEIRYTHEPPAYIKFLTRFILPIILTIITYQILVRIFG